MTFITACSQPSSNHPPSNQQSSISQKDAHGESPCAVITQDCIEEKWLPLYNKLKADNIYGDDIITYFVKLNGNFTQKPMGFKIIELHASAYTPEKKMAKEDTTTPHSSGMPHPLDIAIANDATAQICLDYINANKEAFTYAEKKYNVPKEILSALIYVETRHGNFLGRNNALITLASMSASNQISHLPDYTKKISNLDEKSKWLQTKLDEKSKWAYTELKAFLTYCRENKIDPFTTPSSIYGAIGYCQFMPTNIPLFAVDGDNDGYIHLFSAPDAVASAANYLQKNGWKGKKISTKRKIKALKRYNYSDSYAHTIMALAILTERLNKKN